MQVVHFLEVMCRYVVTSLMGPVRWPSVIRNRACEEYSATLDSCEPAVVDFQFPWVNAS